MNPATEIHPAWYISGGFLAFVILKLVLGFLEKTLHKNGKGNGKEPPAGQMSTKFWQDFMHESARSASSESIREQVTPILERHSEYLQSLTLIMDRQAKSMERQEALMEKLADIYQQVSTSIAVMERLERKA